MVCPKCKASNPDDKRFCGDCGAGLNAVDEDFRIRVQALLREQLKDQRLVEIETADAVMARLKTMAKPFLYTAALFVAVLGVLGFRSIRDFFEALKTAQDVAVQQMRRQAADQSQALAQEADAMRGQLRRLGNQQGLVAQLHQTEAQLKSIQSASQNLRQRYEQLGTELATSQATRPARASASVPSEAGIRSGSGGAGGDESTVLALGSYGPEVTRLQRRLKELGCYGGPASGEFDQATRSAVAKFNEARGEIGVGLVDRDTGAAMFSSKAARCR